MVFFRFSFFSCCKTNRTRCERRAQQNKRRACGWVGSKENKDVFAQGVGAKGGGGRKRKKNTTAATPPHPPKTLSLFLMRFGGKRVCARVSVVTKREMDKERESSEMRFSSWSYAIKLFTAAIYASM